jgi:hypothetical protein
MTPEIYRFRFSPTVSMDRARDLVAHAILAAERVHGPARVRLDVAYFADGDKRSLLVDARTKAGQTVATIFTDLLLGEFDMAAFDVERAPKDDGFIRRGPLGRIGAWLGDCWRGAIRRLTGLGIAAR